MRTFQHACLHLPKVEYPHEVEKKIFIGEKCYKRWSYLLERILKVPGANISRNIVTGDAEVTNFSVELRNSSTFRTEHRCGCLH